MCIVSALQRLSSELKRGPAELFDDLVRNNLVEGPGLLCNSSSSCAHAPTCACARVNQACDQLNATLKAKPLLYLNPLKSMAPKFTRFFNTGHFFTIKNSPILSKTNA